MLYRAFDVPTMIAISGPWVDDSKDKPPLESMPLTAGLVPILTAIHKQLLLLQVSPTASEAAIQALSARIGLLDVDYDDKYCALYSVISGWIAAAAGERRAELETALDTLFPEGLTATQRTYLAESGNVELAASRVTPNIEGVLKSIVVDGKSMFELFNEWVKVGRELGDAERERIRLMEKQAEDSVMAKDILTARFKWIRAVNALVALLDLDSDISEEIRIRLLQPLRTAEAEYAKKESQSDPNKAAGSAQGNDLDAITQVLSKNRS